MRLIYREAIKNEIDKLKKLDRERIDYLYDSTEERIGNYDLIKDDPSMLGWYNSEFFSNEPQKYGYHCIVAVENNNLIGFILIRCLDYSEDNGVVYEKKGVIFKLYVKDRNKKDNNDILFNLIKKASDWFKEEDAEFIEYISTLKEYDNYLQFIIKKDKIFEKKMIYKVEAQELNMNTLANSSFFKVRLIEDEFAERVDIEMLANLNSDFISDMEKLKPHYIKIHQVTPENIKEKFKRDIVYFVLYSNNDIVGYALINLTDTKVAESVYTSFETKTGLLEALFISEELRGKGLGKRLIIEIKNWCYENSVSYLKLDVHTNNKAQHLYIEEKFIPIEYVCRFDLI